MSSRKWAVWMAVVAVLMTIAALAPVSAAVSAGSKAPSFKVSTLEGKSVGLATLSGKPSLIIFWADWCPHCRVELPVMNRIYKDLGSSANFIGISLDTDSGAARRFITDNKIVFPMAIVGPGSSLVKSFGISGIPAVFLLDKEGTIKARWAGEVSESTVRSELAKLGVK